MGVSGAGKTTIGKLLSEKTGLPFFDGDDFHPAANKEKMKAGIALNDEDRKDWLAAINKIAREESVKKGAVIACSALKERYRKILSEGIAGGIHWIFLDGGYDVIERRMKARAGHYMPASLLQSQFDTLEPPAEAIAINIEQSPDEIVTSILKKMEPPSQIGLAGLGVMGKSIARNLSSKGFSLSLYNRFEPGKEEEVAKKFIAGYQLPAARSFEDIAAFADSLQTPRKIILMVSAGKAVDETIARLLPCLSPGDIIIDGGNSHYKDTDRRIQELREKKIHFLGAGISGGEEGALLGPSVMPGGDESAYNEVKPFLEAMAAKDKNGKSCCSYIGSGGSGHFVKMVHNGIEYAEMQLLAEVYHIFRVGLKKDAGEIADIFETWKNEDVNSYLLEITIDILRKQEEGGWLIDKILDVAGGKGTGIWAAQVAAELAVPATLMTEALFARNLSAYKEERMKAAKLFSEEKAEMNVSTGEVMNAYRLARIINHQQGFELLKAASDAYWWKLNRSEIARIWTAGCIIRSELMELLTLILSQEKNILLHEGLTETIIDDRDYLESIVCEAIAAKIPVPVFSSALHYLNGFLSEHLPANLLQAQRDYFGAHTYRRTDDALGRPHHTEWKNKQAGY